MRRSIVLIAGFLIAASSLQAQDLPTARARLIDAQGRQVGEATLRQTPNAGVLIQLRLEGIPAGTHAMHIHETGRCDAPTFESAGGHYAPRGNAHGPLHPHGKHAGDLLNIHVPESGRLVVEQLADGVSLWPGVQGTLFDADGSALIIHTGADDYTSQPTGDAGGRIACGVIERR